MKSLGEKGVTLTELMVVIAVIGVMAAVAVPSAVSWLSVMNLNSAAVDLLGEMRNARQKSISGGRVSTDTTTQVHEYGVWYTSATTYQVIRSSGLDFQSGVSPVIEKTVTLPSGVTLGTVTSNPIFKSDGTAMCINPAGPVVTRNGSCTPGNFVLTNAAGKSKTISVDVGGPSRIQ